MCCSAVAPGAAVRRDADGPSCHPAAAHADGPSRHPERSREAAESKDLACGQCVTNVQRYSIHDIFRANDLPCEVLAASFKNSQQVLELKRYGVGACTISSDVIRGLVKNAAIDSAISTFVADFEGLTAPGTTMATA